MTTFLCACPDQTREVQADLPGIYRISGPSDQDSFAILADPMDVVVVPRANERFRLSADATITKIALLNTVVVGAVDDVRRSGLEKYFILDTVKQELIDELDVGQFQDGLRKRGLDPTIEWQTPTEMCRGYP